MELYEVYLEFNKIEIFEVGNPDGKLADARWV